MPPRLDWLSRLLDLMPVRGRLDLRCRYGAPWRIEQEVSPAGEIPYHIVLAGSATLEGASAAPRRLGPGDILILPHGGAHALHDGSGLPAAPAILRPRLNLILSENTGSGERLDMLCGRFVVTAQQDRWLHAYLPSHLVVGAAPPGPGAQPPPSAAPLAALVALMRAESAADSLGGHAMLNAYSTALFALTLRLASESAEAPLGLLSLAGHPRLAPALAALFQDPAHPWTLPELAALCHMSRATLARHFQERLGRSASDLLTDIRMSLAARELRNPALSTAAVGEMAGYQSEAAFQRAFKLHMGMTPAAWRRDAS